MYIGNTPFQGLVGGGNILDASIEGVDLSTSAIAARLGYTPVDPGAAAFTATLTAKDIQQDNATYIKGKLAAGTATRLFGINGVDTLYIGSIDANHTGGTLFVKNGTAQLTLDSIGNLGLGISPNTWYSTFKAIQFGASGSSIFGRSENNTAAIGSNTFVNAAGSFVYIANGYASYYQQLNGQHQWNIAGNNTSGAGAAANFTQAMVLDTSGYLGVGIASPTQKFHVANAGTVIGVVENTFSTADARLRTKNTQAYLEFGQDATGGYIQQSGAYPVIFYQNASERMRITSGGDTTVQGNFFLQDDVKALVFGSGTTSYIIGSSTNNNIRFWTNSAERVRIASTGFVGIGTTNPQSQLHVITPNPNNSISFGVGASADGAIAYTNSEFRVCAFNIASGSNFRISNMTTSATSWRAILRGTWSNNYEGGGLVSPAPYIEINAANNTITVGSRTVTVTRDASGYLIANGGDAYRIAFTGTIEIFDNTQSAQPTNSIITLGKIGVGVTNPSYPIEASGGIASRGVGFILRSSGGSPNTGILAPYTTIAGSGTDYSTSIFAETGLGIYFCVNGSATRAAVINSSGNMGIGTYTPAARLHTLGASYSSVSSVNNHVRLEGGGGNGIAIGTLDSSTSYATWIQSGYLPNFGTAIYPLLLNPLGGNVSIGTTSNTSAKLIVGGNVVLENTNIGNLASNALSSVPSGISRYTFNIQGDNTWRTLVTNFNDVHGEFLVFLSDSSSGDVARYFVSTTSPAYGVANMQQMHYMDGGWNTGSFEFQFRNINGTYALEVRYSSYYSSSAQGYGNIEFRRL